MAITPPRAARLLARMRNERREVRGEGTPAGIRDDPAHPAPSAPQPAPSSHGSNELLDSVGYAADITFTDTAQRAGTQTGAPPRPRDSRGEIDETLAFDARAGCAHRSRLPGGRSVWRLRSTDRLWSVLRRMLPAQSCRRQRLRLWTAHAVPTLLRPGLRRRLYLRPVRLLGLWCLPQSVRWLRRTGTGHVPLRRPALQLQPGPADRPDRLSVLHGPRPTRLPARQPAAARTVLTGEARFSVLETSPPVTTRRVNGITPLQPSSAQGRARTAGFARGRRGTLQRAGSLPPLPLGEGWGEGALFASPPMTRSAALRNKRVVHDPFSAVLAPAFMPG